MTESSIDTMTGHEIFTYLLRHWGAGCVAMMAAQEIPDEVREALEAPPLQPDPGIVKFQEEIAKMSPEEQRNLIEQIKEVSDGL